MFSKQIARVLKNSKNISKLFQSSLSLKYPLFTKNNNNFNKYMSLNNVALNKYSLQSQFNVFKFSSTAASNQNPPDEQCVTISFVQKDNTTKEVSAKIGSTILDVAKENDIDLEGACEGSMACSTCHVILEQGFYEKLKAPQEEEEDLLDLAFGLTETSRLGCQLTVSKEFENAVFTLPKETRNILKAQKEDAGVDKTNNDDKKKE